MNNCFFRINMESLNSLLIESLLNGNLVNRSLVNRLLIKQSKNILCGLLGMTIGASFMSFLMYRNIKNNNINSATYYDIFIIKRNDEPCIGVYTRQSLSLVHITKLGEENGYILYPSDENYLDLCKDHTYKNIKDITYHDFIKMFKSNYNTLPECESQYFYIIKHIANSI